MLTFDDASFSGVTSRKQRSSCALFDEDTIPEITLLKDDSDVIEKDITIINTQKLRKSSASDKKFYKRKQSSNASPKGILKNNSPVKVASLLKVNLRALKRKQANRNPTLIAENKELMTGVSGILKLRDNSYTSDFNDL